MSNGDVQRAYQIVMSRGDNIRIDDVEIPAVLEAIQKRQPCMVRQGIFNPSFYVSIIEDEERMAEFKRKVAEIRSHNRQDREYEGGNDQRDVPRGLRSLEDIFEPVRAMLEGAPSNALQDVTQNNAKGA